MEKYLALAGIVVISAIAVPKFLEPSLEDVAGQQTSITNVDDNQSSKPKKVSTNTNPLDGRKAIIAMDQRGHFNVDARLNGRKVEVLVDTGATYVAINETTARSIGIRLKDSDFIHPVRTANGITHAAAAVIDEIEIGRVRVKNVQASVSRDEALGVVLLGMSFLKKLDKFEVSGNELLLSQ